MKLLIIGSRKAWESKKILKEAKKKGHIVHIIPITELVLKEEKGCIKDKVFSKNKNLSFYDAVIFRAINRHINEAGVIARYMKRLGKIIVDEIVAEYVYDFHKLLMHDRLSKKNIPQPITYQPLGFKGLKVVLEKLKPPFIVKDVKGMKRKKAYCFKSKKDVLSFFKKENNFNFLIQKLVTGEKHYRIIVLGKKALETAIERYSKVDDNANISLSKNAKEVKLNDNIKNISLKTAFAANTEIAGIDVMFDKNKPIVIEINRAPCFQLFQKTTKINVAKKIVEYIENKLKKSK